MLYYFNSLKTSTKLIMHSTMGKFIEVEYAKQRQMSSNNPVPFSSQCAL